MCRLLVLSCLLALAGVGSARGARGAGVPVPETREAGVPVPETREAGTPVPETREAGAPVPETREAGAPVPEMKEAGSPVPEMKEAIAPGREMRVTRKLEVYDGVYVSFPRDDRNGSDHLLSLDIDLGNGDSSSGIEGRARRKKFMQRILPLFIVPFIVQAAIVPLFLSVLKFMLLKALVVGKTALLLIVVNAFRQSNAFKGRFEQRMADQHYGYRGNGMEEYGVYVN